MPDIEGALQKLRSWIKRPYPEEVDEVIALLSDPPAKVEVGAVVMYARALSNSPKGTVLAITHGHALVNFPDGILLYAVRNLTCVEPATPQPSDVVETPGGIGLVRWETQTGDWEVALQGNPFAYACKREAFTILFRLEKGGEDACQEEMIAEEDKNAEAFNNGPFGVGA